MALLTGAGLVVAAAGAMALTLGGAGQAPDDMAYETYTVVEGPFAVHQSFAGRIGPGEQVEVLAPADASITQVEVIFGDKVEQGQVLFRLSAADVWRAQAEARIAYLQADETQKRTELWADSPEGRRSQRSIDDAELELKDSQRRKAEADRLFERGLIARSEIEGIDRNVRQAEQALMAARDEQAQMIRRSRGAERTISHLQKDLAGSRLRDVNDGDPVVRAPLTGVLVRPATRTVSAEGAAAVVGGRVTKGQSLGVIASLDALDVAFRVDEADLHLLHSGMKAQITGAGFASQVLDGHVMAIAGEAQSDSADKSMFEVRVRMAPLSPKATAQVRIGMTANVRVTLYETQKAVSIPIVALMPDGASVRVRQNDGRITMRAVQTGRASVSDVEILDGLSAGDVVVWPRGA